MTALAPIQERELQSVLKETGLEVSWIGKRRVRRDKAEIIEDVRAFLRDIERAKGLKPLVDVGREFRQEGEQFTSWKRAISSLGQSIEKREIPILLEFLDSNVDAWRELCKRQDLVYISSKGQVRYDFEYWQDGTIWMYYTYRHNKGTHDLAINLETGESCQIIRFSEEVGKRVIGFLPLLREIKGIVQFSEFFQIIEADNRLSFIAKHLPCNATLFENKHELILKKFVGPLQRCLVSLRRTNMNEDKRARIVKAMEAVRLMLPWLRAFEKERIVAANEEIGKEIQSCLRILDEEKKRIEKEKTVLDILETARQFKTALQHLQGPGALESEEIEQQVQMAQQLLQTLWDLEQRGVVHCGIFPSEILCDGRDVYISNLGRVHHSGFLPKELLRVPQKWEVFTPPECANTTLDRLWHPFAIPVFQLGRCFEYCFNYNPKLYLIIEGMTHPDPAKRWTAVQALKELDKEHMAVQALIESAKRWMTVQALIELDKDHKESAV